MTPIEELRKKIESDAALIESLNRYIQTLETKMVYQTDVIKDLKQQLKSILIKQKHNKKRPQ